MNQLGGSLDTPIFVGDQTGKGLGNTVVTRGAGDSTATTSQHGSGNTHSQSDRTAINFPPAQLPPAVSSPAIRSILNPTLPYVPPSAYNTAHYKKEWERIERGIPNSAQSKKESERIERGKPSRIAFRRKH